MGFREIKSRRAVLDAIKECDQLGRERFREHYGFDASDTYYLRHNGVEYDSKPILAVAYKHQFEGAPALENSFSGGKHHAGRHLARLGFQVDGVELPKDDWTLSEVEAVVEGYFAMMAQAQGGGLNKAERIRELEEQLPRRNRSSVSRKLSNISAVLDELELPWLQGFAPLKRRQLLLEAVVNDRLGAGATTLSDSPAPKPAPPSSNGGHEVAPPTRTRLKQAADARRAVRIDFAARDERNRALGRAGEEWALGYLKAELTEAGRPDLAKQVRWVSADDGDGLGYDIASFAPDGTAQLVEVKTTTGGIGAPFLLTPRELTASVSIKGFVLMRIFDFGGELRFYRLRGDLRKACQLQPQLFAALPKGRRG